MTEISINTMKNYCNPTIQHAVLYLINTKFYESHHIKQPSSLYSTIFVKFKIRWLELHENNFIHSSYRMLPVQLFL